MTIFGPAFWKILKFEEFNKVLGTAIQKFRKEHRNLMPDDLRDILEDKLGGASHDLVTYRWPKKNTPFSIKFEYAEGVVDIVKEYIDDKYSLEYFGCNPADIPVKDKKNKKDKYYIEQFKVELENSIKKYTSEIVVLETKYQKMILLKEEKSKKLKEELEYKSLQLEKVKITFQNIEEEYINLKLLVKSMSQKLRLLDPNNEYKVKAQKAIDIFDFTMAEIYLLKARKNETLILKKKTQDAAETNIMLGDISEKRYDYRNALNYFLEANSILPDSHLIIEKIALSYLNMAIYLEALSYFREYHKIILLNYSSSEELLAKAHFNIGLVFSRIGQYKNALQNFNISLHNWNSKYGEDNIDVAKSYHVIGNMYMRLGEYDKSHIEFESSLKIKKAILEKNHILIGTTLNSIGVTYQYQGKLELAENFILRAIDIFNQNKNISSQDKGIALINMAVIYNRKKVFEKAIDYSEKAVKLFSLIFNEKHDHFGRCYANLAESYYGHLDFSNSITYYLKSIEIKKERFGEEHDSIASSYLGLGLSYLKTGNRDEAMTSIRKAYDIFSSTLGTENWNTTNALSIIKRIEKTGFKPRSNVDVFH